MKIISWNVNGIRAVFRKGFFDWLRKTQADIICLQETKAQPEQFPPDLTRLKGYHVYYNSANKKGYSGVVAYSKYKPREVELKLGFERFDQEGRFLKLKFPKFTLFNIYLPHGGRKKENLDYKLETYKCFVNYLQTIEQPKVLLVGDFNVAHKEIDLARPKANKNNIMFTPEERKQIDSLINFGFIDTFREFHLEGDNYTWWPYFVNARERNLGWRIDYVFSSSKLTPKIKKAFILSEVMGSDHCPIGIEI